MHKNLFILIFTLEMKVFITINNIKFKMLYTQHEICKLWILTNLKN